ncbi:hypothetical protein [Coralloluteibacterium stylophorae]|uniref:Uncharacterized protein n=1 Tax=Coralloluteibacterium stylophorae TaxID=1776034 RepID=A0A8J7VUL9_9GAMM|nr:hypothetical protein [Coralloluteibacterium stylophorae]MBS7456791.1 hypothetical protein [Coralloluteibacterium stylophorae]
MARVLPLARLWQSRRTALLAFGIALAALVVAAGWFTSARAGLAQAYATAGNARQALAEARVREQEARLRVDYARSARALTAEAEALGLAPRAWGERLINVRQSQLMRADAADLLASIARTDARIFGAEAFELAVTKPEEGLFDPPAADARPVPVHLTLRGTLLFRTQDARAASPSIPELP